jgi:hypothetical protein
MEECQVNEVVPPNPRGIILSKTLQTSRAKRGLHGNSLHSVKLLHLGLCFGSFSRLFFENVQTFFKDIFLKEICPRGNNNNVIIIFLVHDNIYIPC